MSDTTDVIRGTLKLDTFQEGKVYSDVDSLIKSIADIFSVEIPTSITNVIVSSVEPGDDFKDGVWIRRNTAGTFSGIYLFQSGAWTKVFPEAVIIGETATVGVDTGLWVETDAAGNYEKLWAYQNDAWLQLHPDPSPPDYAAIFATYYRSTIWGGQGVNAGSDNYFVTTVPLIDTLITPTTISFIPDFDNTGPTTLNVNLLGAVPVINSDGSALSGGEFQQSVIVEVTFDSSSWVVSLPADISGAYILDNTITTDKLVDNVINTAKLADVAVIGSKIGIAAVSETKLSPDAVVTAKIADLAVTTAKLALGAITELQLADNAVTTNKINALAVTEAKLDVGAATETKIGPLAVTTAKIADLNVTTGKIADGAVTADKIAAAIAGDGLVGGAGSALDVNVDGSTLEINADTVRVKDAGIVVAKLGASAVETAKIKDLNVTTGKIANSAVTATQIAATVAGAGLLGGGGSALSVGVDNSTVEISGDALRVKASGITSSHLGSNSVDSDELVNGSVDNAHTNFTGALQSPSVRYLDGVALATVPEIRDVRHIALGKVHIITWYINDTTPDYFADSKRGLRLYGLSFGLGVGATSMGIARYNTGAPCPAWLSSNEIYIPFETIAGNLFPTSAVNQCHGMLIYVES